MHTTLRNTLGSYYYLCFPKCIFPYEPDSPLNLSATSGFKIRPLTLEPKPFITRVSLYGKVSQVWSAELKGGPPGVFLFFSPHPLSQNIRGRTQKWAFYEVIQVGLGTLKSEPLLCCSDWLLQAHLVLIQTEILLTLGMPSVSVFYLYASITMSFMRFCIQNIRYTIGSQ